MNLLDCNQGSADVYTEIFVVEGLSAAANVRRGRKAKTQAVLALQGKPVNAAKANKSRIDKDEQLQALTKALGCGRGNDLDITKLRYQRINFLFDPDADGIHCGALVQIFIHQLMTELLHAEKIALIRAPLLRMLVPGQTKPVYAYSEQHYQKICEHFEQQGINNYQSTRFKGVASLDIPLLRESCLEMKTRREHILQFEDAAMAVSIFGGK